MNTFLMYYIDVTVLALCFVVTLIHTVRMVRRATVPLRRVPAYCLVFGATAITVFMGFGHLFEISYHAVERAMTGTFTYDFRFYSLMLLGMVLLSLGVRMLGHIGSWFRGVPGSRRAMLQTMLLIVAISAPTGSFTPIGYVPSIACSISLLALPFVLKKSVTKPNPVTPTAAEMA